MMTYLPSEAQAVLAMEFIALKEYYASRRMRSRGRAKVPSVNTSRARSGGRMTASLLAELLFEMRCSRERTASSDRRLRSYREALYAEYPDLHYADSSGNIDGTLSELCSRYFFDYRMREGRGRGVRHNDAAVESYVAQFDRNRDLVLEPLLRLVTLRYAIRYGLKIPLQVGRQPAQRLVPQMLSCTEGAIVVHLPVSSVAAPAVNIAALTFHDHDLRKLWLCRDESPIQMPAEVESRHFGHRGLSLVAVRDFAQRA